MIPVGCGWLQGSKPAVHWKKWVWNTLNVPKHNFIVWMIQLDKMRTKDKLKRHGITNNADCPMCALAVETKQHLFFECEFSLRCVSVWKCIMGIRCRCGTLNSIVNWIRRNMMDPFYLEPSNRLETYKPPFIHS